MGHTQHCKTHFVFCVSTPPQTWFCKPQWEAVWSWGACRASAYTFCPTGIIFKYICWDQFYLKDCQDMFIHPTPAAPLHCVYTKCHSNRDRMWQSFWITHDNHLFPFISHHLIHPPPLPLLLLPPPSLPLVTNRSHLLRAAWWCTCGPPPPALSPIPSRDQLCRSTSLSSSAPPLTPILAATLPTPPLPLPLSPLLKGQRMAWRWATHCKYR